MTVHSTDFEILEFMGYPSFQQSIIAEYDEWEKRGDIRVKRFFENILKKAEKSHPHLMDNKVVFKIRFVSEENPVILYVGYKDNHYRISLTAYTESSKKINFKL